jgi:hypothetical protein
MQVQFSFVPAASQDTQYLLEAGQSLDAAVTLAD